MLQSFVMSFALVGACLAGSVSAQDEGPQRWRLDFEAEKPRTMTFRDAAGRSHTYWYLTYTVNNETGAERPLTLGFRLITDLQDPKDRDQPRVYMPRHSAKVEAAAEKRLGKELKGTAEVVGATIGAGETVEGIVVFGEVDPNVDQFDIEVRGLVDPLSREGARAFVERKVLLLHFERKGDEFLVALDGVKRRSREWKILSRDEVRLPRKYDGR